MQESSLTVHIGKGILQKIVEQASSESPLETCGLLLGWREKNTLSVTDTVRAENVSPTPRVSYEIKPQIVLAHLPTNVTHSANKKCGLIGFYHSHPKGALEPSRRDLVEAWPDMLNLIVGSPEIKHRCIFFWRNTEILYAAVVDQSVSGGPALTRFSQGSTITVPLCALPLCTGVRAGKMPE